MLDAKRADGMILLNGSLPPTEAGRNRPAPPRYPIVAVSERIPGAVLPTVGIDNVQAARDAVEHLARQGHRRIAHVGGPPGNILTAERRQGYQDGLAAFGLAADDGQVVHGNFTIESGRRAAARLLAADPRPTAIFASNDEMAIGAILAAKAQGLRVPQDLSVVGFDDIEFADAYDPPLTTVRQPRHEMGRAAMSLLVDLLEGRGPTAGEVVLGHELTVRASSAWVPEERDARRARLG
jgi:LacI family repressor for deo operon, udp, cdd, tsx, nupC, and nupG